jgi:LytR cell envelope-related transcriptional attenuator
VEHAYDSGQPVATPWRTAAIVAVAVAAVELFVLIVVGVVFGAKVLTDQAEKAVTPPRAAAEETVSTPAATTAGATKEKANAAAPAELPRSQTSVIVLNGNGVSGAAAVTADKVREFRYIIAATGNAPRSDFQRSIVMYRPGFEAEAVRLARDLHVRRAVPLDGLTRRDLQGAHLALIIGG